MRTQKRSIELDMREAVWIRNRLLDFGNWVFVPEKQKRILLNHADRIGKKIGEVLNVESEIR